jgi:cation diffusion facilitator family transporter
MLKAERHTRLDGIRADNVVERKRAFRLSGKQRVSRRFTLLNVLVNAVLGGGKLALGLLTGSLSIVADGLNNLSDTVYSLFLLVGMWFSLKPADARHPQGHRAIEPIISLVIGVSIGVVAYRLALSGVRGIIDPTGVERNALALPVLGGGMAAKTFIAVYARRASRQIHSPALAATGMDAAADVLATAAAVVGYLGGTVFGLPRADPICALVVSLFVAFTAFEVLRQNIGYMVGRAAPPEIRRQVKALACREHSVLSVHDLKAYFRGPELMVSMHVEVDGDLSLQTAHDLEQRIRLAVLDIPEIDDVTVHMDPLERTRDDDGREVR